MYALLRENGPCLTPRGKKNYPQSVFVEHRVAHVILIDQPAGVGFSYQDENTAPVGNEEEVSKDVDKFLQLFFADHPELVHSPFFLAGGSYG
jgi:carboxypeptidase C (cathepsin A)